MSSTITHIGFADESHWNTGRFRSIGMVTLALNCLEVMERDVRRLLKESQVGEFKWKNLDGAKERFAAEKLCQFAIEKACAGQLRADVLVWDIEDSRHKIQRRDDIANLQRMYYHVFRKVLRTRWPHDSIWRLHPDEHTAMDWNTVEDCLGFVASRAVIECSLFTEGKFRIRLRQEFGLEEIRPAVSGECPLLQVADLFAGLAVFSRVKFNEYSAWLRSTNAQTSLFSSECVPQAISASTRERCQVLRELDGMCKARKLGVSLKRNRGLRTLNPENPLNFWLYEPQHDLDKAPTRGWAKRKVLRSKNALT